MDQRKPLKIAIVEDNPSHRETYRNMILLDASSHEVETFEKAQQFLNAPEPVDAYDCILLDIKLPDMNGIDLSAKIREQSPLLPIVFITAYSDDDEALETLAEGAEDYLPKGEYNQKLFMRSIRYAIERKKYQAERLELMESLKLQKELNAQQKEFVSMVSHEFRTPLAIISSSAQMLERLNKDSTDESSAKHLDKIHNAIKRLTNLIENTLCYSKLEEGKITFNPSPFNLQQIVIDMIESYRLLHPDTQFTLEGESDLPKHYNGDSDLIHHILLNLLSNAIKYSGKENRHVIVKIQADNTANELRIDIVDHGRGIPEKALHRIGERFYRADNVVGVSGSGIGLHLVQRLLAMHKGRLDLQSKENTGTTAHIILPLTPTEEIAP